MCPQILEAKKVKEVLIQLKYHINFLLQRLSQHCGLNGTNLLSSGQKAGS